MIDASRREPHRRPAELEAWLRHFERLLGPVELRQIESVPLCDEPIIFLMGCARSGSTLLLQYLAESKLFSYPTNFVSRFFFAPLVGAQLQEMLFSADFRGEVFPAGESARFESDLGKTKGPLAPHEFWYFWRRFFSFGETQKLDAAAIEAADWNLFLKELRALQSVKARPLALKGMILNWDIASLARLWERCCFVFVRRNVAANADSLIRARRHFYGDERQWYSFKPPGFEKVLGLDPRRQVAWQVLATNDAVERGLAEVPRDRALRIDYEDFCAHPAALLETISARWNVSRVGQGSNLPRQFAAARPQELEVNWASVIDEVSPMIARVDREGG
jgi:hypothetical protein